jgi:hypothetical protein
LTKAPKSSENLALPRKSLKAIETAGGLMLANDDKMLRVLLALAAGVAALVYVCAVAITGIHIQESAKYLAGGLTFISAALAGVLLRSGDRRTGCGYIAIAAVCMCYFVSSATIAIQAPLSLLMLVCPLVGFACWPRGAR